MCFSGFIVTGKLEERTGEVALGLWSGLTAYSLPHSHNELTVCMNFHVTPSTRHYDIIKRHLLPVKCV